MFKSGYYTLSPLLSCLFRKTTVWVWLKGSGEEKSDQVGFEEPVSQACTQTALGTRGRWRKAQCAGRYFFLCEKEVTGKTFISLENTRGTHETNTMIVLFYPHVW